MHENILTAINAVSPLGLGVELSTITEVLAVIEASEGMSSSIFRRLIISQVYTSIGLEIIPTAKRLRSTRRLDKQLLDDLTATILPVERVQSLKPWQKSP